MNVTHPDIVAVINRFPDHKKTINKLFRENHDFQSICEDYRKCLDAISFWTQSDKAHAAISAKEYSTLLQELESEIFEHLNDNS